MKNGRLVVGSVILFAWALSSCARHSKNFYFGDYSDAEKYFVKGDYDKAIRSYQAYIDENPEGNLAVIAEYYIGKSYQSLGQPEQARGHYQGLIDQHPDAVWANFSRARLKELEADPSGAEALKT